MFSILRTNIQYIRAKFTELKYIFVEALQEIDFSFSSICVQERWFSVNEDTSQLQLKGHDCILQGQQCSSKGGMIMIDKTSDYAYTKKLIGCKPRVQSYPNKKT